MSKSTIDFITMGCSKNLVDTERLMRQMQAAGYRVRHDAVNPDGRIAVVNTCGFIGDAKEESIATILQLAERKQQGKLDKLYVMGCLSERYLHELESELPEVDKFYGKFNYFDLLTDLRKPLNRDLLAERVITTPGHYAYVKISEGCNRTCSYCAIPIITGVHRSCGMDDIADEVRWLVKQGVKEFQLIAQDLSFYGVDLYGEMKLADLVRRLSDIPGVEWLRLHYAYPAHFPFDLLPVMRERDNVCNYLDIALQHISDHVLSLMRRNITSAQTYELLERIRMEVPGIHLRTTLLLGHPGETEDDVQQLEEFVRKVRFERLGAFAYSDEDGTYANRHYTDDVPQVEKEHRVERIMTIQEGISATVNATKVGMRLRCIIDREEEDYYIGRTEYDSPDVDGEVLIAKDTVVATGNFYSVEIVGAEDFDLYGKIILETR